MTDPRTVDRSVPQRVPRVADRCARRCRSWFTVVLCAICCLSSMQTLRAAVIELKPHATVSPNTIIQLQQIATITEHDAATAKRLASVTLVPAPATGRVVRITYEEVRLRLQACGMNLAELEFRGSLACEVRCLSGSATTSAIPTTRSTASTDPSAILRASHTDSPSRWQRAKVNDVLTTAFRRAFRAGHLEASGWTVRCEAEPMDVPRLVKLSPEQIRFRTTQISRESPQQIVAEWQDADGTPQSVTAQLWIEQLPKVLALRQGLPAGAIIRPEDVTWVPVSVRPAESFAIGDLVGKQTLRPLRAGHVVQPDDVTTVPLVKSQEIVTVSVRRNGVTVRRPFKANASGGLHDVVQLTALDDPRLRIQAVITGYREATVAGEPIEDRNLFRDPSGRLPLGSSNNETATGGRP